MYELIHVVRRPTVSAWWDAIDIVKPYEADPIPLSRSLHAGLVHPERDLANGGNQRQDGINAPDTFSASYRMVSTVFVIFRPMWRRSP